MVHNFNLFCKKKHTFSILHTHFYKTLTSVYLLYNIFLFYFLLTFKLSTSLFSLTHKLIPQSSASLSSLKVSVSQIPHLSP